MDFREELQKKIDIYFWQNCVSPHQLPYIKELVNDKRVKNVFLICPIYSASSRERLGWSVEYDTSNINLILNPKATDVNLIFKSCSNDSIHLFSGIRADKFVFNYFKSSLRYNIHRHIITEGPFVYDKPLWLHTLRFLLLDFKFLSKIESFFTIGDNAINFYNYFSCKVKIFPFAYCVERTKSEPFLFGDTPFRFVFVGNLIKRKNVFLLMKSINYLKRYFNYKFTLDIIGDGPELLKLKQFVDENSLSKFVTFRGSLPINIVQKELQHYDALILPSKYDGWGAVINEALHHGLFVIISSSCGSKCLVEGTDRGYVFINNDLNSLSEALVYSLVNKDSIRTNRSKVINWSKNISGTRLSHYMLDCLLSNVKSTPPWKEN